MKFSEICDYYADRYEQIMAAPRNEWGIDPYAWDEAGITLTHIEAWLWHDIRAVDVVLYPQFPVLNYFADFANPKARVVIECDGAAFHKDVKKDAMRDKRMREAGWTVYRISGKDCRSGVDLKDGEYSAARVFISEIAKKHGIARA